MTVRPALLVSSNDGFCVEPPALQSPLVCSYGDAVPSTFFIEQIRCCSHRPGCCVGRTSSVGALLEEGHYRPVGGV